MPAPLGRRLGAEALGSLLLAATVIGSGIMAERLAAGNAGVALLGNTLATVAMLGVLIFTLGPLSGAHFNPVVSLIMRLRGELTTGELLAYAITQLVAMIAGALLAHAMFGLALLQSSAHVRSSLGEMLGEGVATFILLFTILGTLRRDGNAVALTVPAAIAAGYWFTSSTSFANPAITVARSLTDTFSGIAAPSIAGFVVAQCIGAMAAFATARWLWPANARAE
jgi:glycerol uptake facilitator-like aquaporin